MLYPFLLLLFLVIIVCVSCYKPEPFIPGKSFARYYKPQTCNTHDDCFRGSVWRSEIYQDVCQPPGKLNRTKNPLITDCIKRL